MDRRTLHLLGALLVLVPAKNKVACVDSLSCTQFHDTPCATEYAAQDTACATD